MIDEIDVIDEIEIDDAPAYPLAIDEANALSRCEAVIARGVQTFIEVGEALAEIRDGKLYRADFTTFEHYCRNKWGIGDSRARQLIGAAAVARHVESVTTVTVANERQAREMMKLDPDQQVAAAERAVKIAGNAAPTAAHFKQAAAEIEAPDLPIEFAVIQRRFEAHGHVLSAAWDGVTRRYVVRKDGSTGIVMLWPDVLTRLEKLDAEPPSIVDPSLPDPAAPTLADLDGTLPKKLSDAGYFWESATPPVIRHNDGWRADAPTVDLALACAWDREKQRTAPMIELPSFPAADLPALMESISFLIEMTAKWVPSSREKAAPALGMLRAIGRKALELS